VIILAVYIQQSETSFLCGPETIRKWYTMASTSINAVKTMVKTVSLFNTFKILWNNNALIILFIIYYFLVVLGFFIIIIIIISFILTRRVTLRYYYLFFQRDLVKTAAQEVSYTRITE